MKTLSIGDNVAIVPVEIKMIQKLTQKKWSKKEGQEILIQNAGCRR
jgi:hypothetical protein